MTLLKRSLQLYCTNEYLAELMRCVDILFLWIHSTIAKAAKVIGLL